MVFVHFKLWEPMDAAKAAYAAEEKVGYYFTQYDPKTGEGYGWFGTEEEPMYFFRRELIFGDLGESTRGFGKDCIWSAWRF